MLRIRDYEASRDRAAVRELFVMLHEVEREIDPRMRTSEEIADAYLDQMAMRCREWDGVLLVATGDEKVIGYACVYRRYVSDELDDPPGELAYLSDLVVNEAARGAGVAAALLDAVEARAREAGVETLRLSVLAGNARARAFYEKTGFDAVELELEKQL